MPPKRPTPFKVSGSKPNARKKLRRSVGKVQLVNMLQRGKNYTVAGRCFDVNKSTIRYTEKNVVGIRSTVAVSLFGSE